MVAGGADAAGCERFISLIMSSLSLKNKPEKGNGFGCLTVNKEMLPHLAVLGVCAGILSGLWLLSPPEGTSGSVQFFGISLPAVCSFRRTAGLPCPGCGLTRSLTEIMHGNTSAGFDYHSLGLITLVYITLQIIYRGIWILFPSIRKTWDILGLYLNQAFIYLAVLFGLNWMNQILWRLLSSEIMLCLL